LTLDIKIIDTIVCCCVVVPGVTQLLILTHYYSSNLLSMIFRERKKRLASLVFIVVNIRMLHVLIETTVIKWSFNQHQKILYIFGLLSRYIFKVNTDLYPYFFQVWFMVF